MRIPYGPSDTFVFEGLADASAAELHVNNPAGRWVFQGMPLKVELYKRHYYNEA